MLLQPCLYSVNHWPATFCAVSEPPSCRFCVVMIHQPADFVQSRSTSLQILCSHDPQACRFCVAMIHQPADFVQSRSTSLQIFCSQLATILQILCSHDPPACSCLCSHDPSTVPLAGQDNLTWRYQTAAEKAYVQWIACTGM